MILNNNFKQKKSYLLGSSFNDKKNNEENYQNLMCNIVKLF